MKVQLENFYNLYTELHFGAYVAPAYLPLPAPSFLCKSLLAKPDTFHDGAST